MILFRPGEKLRKRMPDAQFSGAFSWAPCGSGDGVIPALMKRVAAKYPAQRQIPALDRAVFFDGLNCILRACRNKPAAGLMHGGYAYAVKANQPKHSAFGQ